MGAAGFSPGVVFGGIFTQTLGLTRTLGWRGVLFYAPLSLLVLGTAGRILEPDPQDAGPDDRVAWLPAALITGGLVTIL
jgi:hypothetical protein